MKLTARVALPLALATLTLTGCSQSNTDAPQAVDAAETTPAAPETYKGGTYTTNISGADTTLKLPTKATDGGTVAKIDGLRKDLKQPELTYIVADVDNRKGSETVAPSSITVHDQSGKEYEFNSASSFIGDSLTPTLTENSEYKYPDGSAMTEDEYDILNGYSRELYNSLLDPGKAGARGEQVWVYQGKMPEAFTTPTASVAGESEPLALTAAPDATMPAEATPTS